MNGGPGEAAPSALVGMLLPLILGIIGGAFSAFVGVRVRLATMQSQINENTKLVNECQGRIDSRLGRMDRRQIMTLQVLADVARKVGADARMSDMVLRFLASEDGPSGSPRRDYTELEGGDK